MFQNINFEFIKDRVCILTGELDECERFYCSFKEDFSI